MKNDIEREQGGWIPVVNHRRRREVWRKEASKGLFSVFVDNIPYKMDPKALFHLFTKFGVVRDVFIRQKRRKVTNTRFGFVRFDCSVAANIAVQKANGLWVEDRELKVNMAEYGRIEDRSAKRNQSGGNIDGNEDRGRYDRAHHGLQRSFADVVKDGINTQMGKADSTIKMVLKENGMGHVLVRNGGGRNVVLTFLSKDDMLANLLSIKEWFKDWCESIKIWDSEVNAEQERCLWLRCYGVPLSMWNRSTFSKIGSRWGSVLVWEQAILPLPKRGSLDGNISQPQSFSHGRVRIATGCMEFINQTINLECKGRIHPVLVCEEQLHNSFDSGSILSSELLEDRNSNEVDKHDPVGVGHDDKSADNLVVEEEDDEAELETNLVDTIVEETASGVGNNLVVEERMELVVAGSSLEANDDNLRTEGQQFTPGFLKCLNGSDVHGPGISLEVNLGHLYGPVEHIRSDIVVRGPNSQPNVITNSFWASKRPSMPTVQTSPPGVINNRTNVQKSKRKDGGCCGLCVMLET
ncbi:hypothetical protein ACSBR1_030118 [Camellia fascicularis]